MAHDQDTLAMQLPRPDPALNRLARSAGAWHVTGRTLGPGPGQDTVCGRVTRQETNQKLVRRLGGRCRS